MANGSKWRSRIVGTGAEDPRTIASHPLNYRIHSEVQAATMTGALETIGWWQHVTINRTTGRLLDGHLRVGLACRDGEEAVPVAYVELSEEEEAAALASGDPIGAMATTDHAKLNALLDGVDVADAALTDLFDTMLTDAANATLRSPGEDGEDEEAERRPGGKKTQRGLGNVQVKSVISLSDTAILERALRATGENNRGKALVQVCRTYLDHAKR
jgi:hypothetical protein